MRYYYGQLTKPLQGVYDTLLSGFRGYAPSIRIPDVALGQGAAVYLRLQLDEPQGVGVCEGIAKTVKALCDRLGLWCIVALSEAAPERGIRYRHTWNVLRIGGQYYHLDATFDNSLQRGVKRYDYCNLDDSRCFRDHESLVFPIPACTDGRAFYYRNVSFTKPEELEKRLAQALRKKQPVFVFPWRGGGLNRQILSELLALAGTLAQARGKQASCSVNVPQAVIQLQFSDAPEPDITIQQANEGEAAPEAQTVSE